MFNSDARMNNRGTRGRRIRLLSRPAACVAAPVLVEEHEARGEQYAMACPACKLSVDRQTHRVLLAESVDLWWCAHCQIWWNVALERLPEEVT